MLFHVRMDSVPWGPDPTLAKFDSVLQFAGSTILDLPFTRMGLESDGVHFTLEGQDVFSTLFAKSLRKDAHNATDVLIISDSTIDFHNWSEDGEWLGKGTLSLKNALFANGFTNSIIDAVCGSGFVARANFGEHFHARLSHHLRKGYRGPIVFVGGWNDVNDKISHVENAMTKCVSLIERFTHVYKWTD